MTKPIHCTCGYEAADQNDFDQHVLASMQSDEDHFEVRKNGDGR